MSATTTVTLEDRIQQLEKSLSALASRIETLEKGSSPKATAPAVAAAPAAKAVSVVDSNKIDPRHLALISAAVYAMIKKPHAIQEIVVSTPTVNLWAQQGRHSIFESHRIH